MLTKSAFAAMVLAVLSLLSGQARCQRPTSAPAVPAPENGPSVQFANAPSAHLSLADLRGKVVVVVFYQSWCPICNGWSARFFAQLEQAAADKREVVLLAVKTDGGSAADIAGYLKGRITDPSRWVIGADQNATWYQVASGGNELYGFMIVGPDGNIVDSGKAGMYRASGPDKEKYVLPLELAGYVDKLKPSTILPKGKTYHESLKQAVMAAEMRQFMSALQLCGRASGKEAVQSAGELKKDLADWAAEQVKTLGAVLSDQQGPSSKRFDAYLEMKQIADGLPQTDAGKDARKAVTEAAKDKAVLKEIQAQNEYMAIMAKAVSAPKLAKNADFVAVLKAMAAKYPETKFGKMAAAAASRVGS